jgi:hypothetical protein
MRTVLASCAAIAAVGLAANTASALIPVFVVLEGPITNPANGHQYEIIGAGPGGTAMSWTTAEADAQLAGGNLTTINDDAENTWIVQNLLVDVPGGMDFSDIPLWIGLSDPDVGDGSGATHAADFTWADGDTSTYRNWNTGTGEPNNDGGIEYYAAINWHVAQSGGPVGTWNDTPVDGTVGFGGTSDGPYFGIVEIAPEPASLGLLGFGAAMLIGRRRR